MLCVAPLVTSRRSSVQFWAAGQDCCPKEGAFDCYDARHGAREGLVYLDDELFEQNLVALLRRAAQAAVLQHGLRASKDALFVALHLQPTKELEMAIKIVDSRDMVVYTQYVLYIEYISRKLALAS